MITYQYVAGDLRIPLKNVVLEGEIHVPDHARGFVIFSHGSGSSRLSPRNQHVARYLEEQDMATLLFDLLTVEEDRIYQNRFNIPKLTERLIEVTDWLMAQDFAAGLDIGYFGASTGAASALSAAAVLGDKVRAVVSRGGRPDLAIPVLPKVSAATLLIVGGLDTDVIELNKQAYAALQSEKELRIIAGAGHLFEEPGKMDIVADMAVQWFLRHLSGNFKL